MAAIIHSPLQNLKWLKIRYKYIEQFTEVVFGCFYMFTSVFHCNIEFYQRYYVLNEEDTCHQ